LKNKIFGKNIEPGTEITPLAKVPTSQMLVKWAGATGDFNPLHYDDHFAGKEGVGSRIIHGELKRAWLVQMLTDWIGEEGFIKKLSCQYRALDHPRLMKTPLEAEEGETYWCKGRVIKKYVEDKSIILECEVWVENGQGEVTTPGQATVVLPG
jgi:hypothetical protein